MARAAAASLVPGRGSHAIIAHIRTSHFFPDPPTRFYLPPADNMDAIISAHQSLEKKGNLSKTITDVQALIDQLQQTRDAVAANPELTGLHMAKLKQPVKASFDKIEEDLKEVNKGLNHYQKALKDKFKNSQLPTAGNEVLESQEWLVNRSIAMHLLREGKFGVSKTFVREVNEKAEQQRDTDSTEERDEDESRRLAAYESWMNDFSDPDAMAMDLDAPEFQLGITREDGEVLEGKGNLQRKFAEMYLILDALQSQHNLEPAIAWAREHSTELEARGSNLEFELCRLKFVELYTSSSSSSNADAMSDADEHSGLLAALQYAQTVFPPFSSRYSKDISNLVGSLAFSPSLDCSPYHNLFFNAETWHSISQSFTREFCTLLGLSSTSPLYTALTAGSIALPVLQKYSRIITTTKGQWTSANELPVETPLPPQMLYHSIFVCPVSKEQATDTNFPVMLPCGHVIARESLQMHARGKTRVKCPYCPVECAERDAKRVYI